jgi:hypothetical protein
MPHSLPLSVFAVEISARLCPGASPFPGSVAASLRTLPQRSLPKPVSNYPEVKGAVQEYRRLTMFEHVRMIIDEVNDARRMREARED